MVVPPKDKIRAMIERWSYPDGRVQFLWSAWHGGTRIQMGGPYPSAEAAEAEARAFCTKELGREPDSIERL
ncbi:MAG: hypothetical protein ACREGL_05650 [Alphaproteobacteria bacterium]